MTHIFNMLCLVLFFTFFSFFFLQTFKYINRVYIMLVYFHVKIHRCYMHENDNYRMNLYMNGLNLKISGEKMYMIRKAKM